MISTITGTRQPNQEQSEGRMRPSWSCTEEVGVGSCIADKKGLERKKVVSVWGATKEDGTYWGRYTFSTHSAVWDSGRGRLGIFSLLCGLGAIAYCWNCDSNCDFNWRASNMGWKDFQMVTAAKHKYGNFLDTWDFIALFFLDAFQCWDFSWHNTRCSTGLDWKSWAIKVYA